MHNLGTVFQFEVTRTLKKKSFWLMAIAFPVMIFAIYAIVYFSNISTQEAAENTVNQKFSLLVDDESGLINDSVLQQLSATKTSDKQSAIKKVTGDQVDASFTTPLT
jgi:ABC-2 type transport system permease protein